MSLRPSTPDCAQYPTLRFSRTRARTGGFLVTHDADFTVFHHQGLSHAGIDFCAPLRRSIGQLVESLALIYEVMEAEEMVGRLEFL